LPVQIPRQLLESLKGIRGFDEEAFIKVHQNPEPITSIRINPHKKSEIRNLKSKIPWTETGYYLASRPSFTFDPLFHAGCYYVQEASSMFLEQALRQTADLSKPIKVLDLAAAPGGKSTHIQSLISKDSLLVSNEVIRSRANILKENIIKWGCENVIVTNNDPADFKRLENYFDVIVVDAPCSGSGLFRKDEEAMGEWSLNNVQLCSQRQQRILADVWPSLKNDGVLIYSTCSYSKEEDEDILDWMMEELAISNWPLAINSAWGITETRSASGAYGYRFWPDKLKGEGFFLACFKKLDGETESGQKSKRKISPASKKEIEILEQWVSTKGLAFVKFGDIIHAIPVILARELDLIIEKLKPVYAGVAVGEVMKEKLVPEHALAVSKILAPDVKSTGLDRETAIKYLQRKELPFDLFKTGWQLVKYEDAALGWVNALSNRVNNYYPKELRILKDI